MKMLFTFFFLLPFLSFTTTDNIKDVFFGDSITYGNELYPNQYTERWPTKYCNSKHSDELNYAYSGAAMTPGLNAGRPVFNINDVPNYQSTFKHIFVSYWVNDFMYGGTPSAFASATSAAVDGIIAKGWPVDKIVLCFNYLPDSYPAYPGMTHAIALQWLDALKGVYRAKGTSFLDFYTPIYNRPDNATYSTDYIHPTAAWNTIMEQYAETNIVGPSNTLPATFIGFSGQRQTGSNVLKWTVAQEQNVSTYEVERSVNGSDWIKAGSVNSLGNSTAQRSYTYVDNGISGAKQLYRIIAVDKNGAMKNSNIIIISGLKPTGVKLSALFPNPTAANINLLVEAPSKDNITIQVLDIIGHLIKSQKAVLESGSNNIEINTSNLKVGSYIVKLVSESTSLPVMGKFVKD